MQLRIKLLLLIPHLGGGGAERVVFLLARHLPVECFEIHLGVFTKDGPGAQAVPEWVTVHRLNVRRVRDGWLRLLRLVYQVRPDVVLSGMAHLNFLVLLLRPLMPRRVRVLVRQNGTASVDTNKAARLGYRYLYPRADRIVCQTAAMAEDLRTHFGIVPDKLGVLANPIESGAATSPRGFPGVGPHLLCVGRLSKEKGVDLLLYAMVGVRDRFPAAHLTVLGVGGEEKSLRDLTEGLSLQEAVTFAGYAAPADYYSRSTLFVLPSRSEGMPNALLEAASAGMPIVATPCCDGVTELLRSAPGAWLASSVSSEALAGAIVDALDTLRQAGGTLPRFEHRFLAPFALDASIAAYTEFLAGPGPASGRGRVALVIPTVDQIGGAERQVLLLARELSARGWKVTLIALSGTGSSIASELLASEVEFVSLAMRRGWVDARGWMRYLKWWRTRRPQIVHAHLPHASWFARWVRLVAPVCVVVDTIHTSRTAGRGGGPGRRVGYRVSNWLSNRITGVSHAVRQAVVDASMVRPGKVVVIPNGVVLPDARPHRVPDSLFRWVAVGRLAPVKDYPTLLCAFALTPDNTRLQIAGSGPEEAALLALASALHVQERVEFSGFQTDVQTSLAAADGFVLASLWEGLPVSVLEASAAGLPVVATNAAGTAEALVEGVTGLLVPVGNSIALSEAMTQVMTMSEEERRRMGENGRSHVAERYSLEKVVDQWERLYFELLRQYRNPSS